MLEDLTPLQARIVEALKTQPRQRMNYHSLMYALWPPEQHPKAWRYSSNGGPPGCAMAFGRALRQLQSAKMVWETHEEAGRGDILLLSSNVLADRPAAPLAAGPATEGSEVERRVSGLGSHGEKHGTS